MCLCRWSFLGWWAGQPSWCYKKFNAEVFLDSTIDDCQTLQDGSARQALAINTFLDDQEHNSSSQQDHSCKYEKLYLLNSVQILYGLSKM